MPRVVAIGGEANKNSVELAGSLELSPNCLALPDLSHSPEGHVAAIVNGKLVVCTGRTITNCYSHNKDLARWEVTGNIGTARWLASSLMVSANEWWIAGGKMGNNPSDSTLVFDGAAFTPGHPLPIKTMGSCLARVNASHIFLVGGYDENKIRLPVAYFLEWATGTWTKVSDMSVGRSYPACGRAGNDMVVVGGWNETSVALGTTELFSLATQMWRAGPDVPPEIGVLAKVQGASIQIPEEDTFVVVGGTTKDGENGKILKYGPGNWHVMNEVVGPRANHAVVEIPSDFAC